MGRSSEPQDGGRAGVAGNGVGPEPGSLEPRPGIAGRSRPRTRPSVPENGQIARARCSGRNVAVVSVGTTPVSRVSRRMSAFSASRNAAIV